jgi:hypothetical protein
MNRAILGIVVGFVLIGNAYAGEKALCNLQPISNAAGWHYRTKVGGRDARCYYIGERMKPRSELFWAELPAIPPADPGSNGFELRWHGHPIG